MDSFMALNWVFRMAMTLAILLQVAIVGGLIWAILAIFLTKEPPCVA